MQIGARHSDDGLRLVGREQIFQVGHARGAEEAAHAHHAAMRADKRQPRAAHPCLPPRVPAGQTTRKKKRKKERKKKKIKERKGKKEERKRKKKEKGRKKRRKKKEGWWEKKK